MKDNVNLDSIFDIHGAALLARGRRAEILAANIANADTPNYKARDVDFNELMRSAMDGADAGRLTKTSATHLDIGSDRYFGSEVMYREPHQASLDGNTVDTQREQAEFMKNSMEYQTSLMFINRKIDGLRMAIKGE
jgi:flagellar basal-body rod protein FlgB